MVPLQEWGQGVLFSLLLSPFTRAQLEFILEDEGAGVYSFASEYDFVVEVGGGGAAGASNLRDFVPTLYPLVAFDDDAGVVSESCDDSIPVGDLHDVAIAASGACECDDSVSRGVDRGARIVGDIDAFVKSASSRKGVHAVAELRADPASCG